MAQIVSLDNPAGRLYAILTDVVNKGESLGMARSHTSISTVFASALEVDNNNFEVIIGLGKIFELIDSTRESIKKLNNIDTDLYLSPLEELAEAFLKVRLSDNWVSSDAVGIDKKTLDKLKFCAYTFSREQGEILLNAGHLNELLSEVRVLLDKVLDSKLDVDIKRFLVEKLRDIEQVIINYKFEGPEGIRKVFESTIGGAVLNANVKEKKENPLVTNFFTLVMRLAAILNIANTTKQLGPDVSNILSKLLSGDK